MIIPGSYSIRSDECYQFLSVSMSRRSRRSIELPWLRPFIRASWWDPSSLAPVAFSGMDMENEKIYVSNLGNDAVSLGGYCICDFNQNHWFKFPSSFVLSPRATVSVFCCPGLHMDRDPVQPFLQWTNKDGTLRRYVCYSWHYLPTR